MFLLFSIIAALLVIIAGLWIACFIYMNDFTVPMKRLMVRDKKVLVVFPHADDEALNAGGLLSCLAKKGNALTWVILTRGEKGTPKGELNEDLRAIRTHEAERVAQIFGLTKPIQKDYPDGDVVAYRGDVQRELAAIIQESRPDIVITYDMAGMYGHSDHIVTSEIVTELVQNDPTIGLWYVSYPKRFIDSLTLAEHMAKDPAFKARRVYPTWRAWVGFDGIMRKMKAVKAYESQRNSYKTSFPIQWIPLGWYISLMFFEYYHEAKR